MADRNIDKERERQEQDSRIEGVLAGIQNKYLVMSGKGGVGKSTVAVNLAVALAERGSRVGLMDVDLHGPNTLKMLGLEGKPLETDGRLLVPLKFNSRLGVISISSLLDSADTAIIWRGPLKIGVIKQFIADVAWGSLDYLVIDSPPGTGDEPLTVAQVIPGAKGVIVTTPQQVSVMDIRRSITFCRQVSMPIAGLIENMSGLSCPHCGKRIELFGSGGGEKAAEDMGVPFLGSLPLDPDVVSAGDDGKPYILSHPATAMAEGFSSIVDTILKAEN